jgi:DNA-binding transcriptional LysR family regulator
MANSPALAKSEFGQRRLGSPPARASAKSPETLIHQARQGLGNTMLSDHFAYKLVQSGELVQVLGDWQIAPVNAWAVFPGRRLMPARTRVFLDALQVEFSGPGCERVEAEIGKSRA